MNGPAKLKIDSPAVQSHLQMLQGIITRLASNSAGAKSWCIGLVSGLTLLVAEAGKPELLVVPMLPIVLFAALDAYYLGLERQFRRAYSAFARKLHDGTATVDDAFVLSPPTSWKSTFSDGVDAVFSFSVWPFYGGLALLLVLIKVRLS